MRSWTHFVVFVKEMESDMLKFTTEEANGFIAETKKAFDVVRVVNASVTKPVDVVDCGKGIEGESCCFALWQRNERCDNCITARALAEKSRVMKFEALNDDNYFVVANYSEIDGKPYVIEVGVKLDEDMMFSAFGKGEIQRSINNFNHKMYRDTLTGVYNRRFYEEQLAVRQAEAVAMLDMDNLKLTNDSYGHKAGDLALQHLMSCVTENVRGDDKVVRFGGDEFVITFESISKEDFAACLERIRERVEHESIPEYPDLKITVSAGGIYSKGAVRDLIDGADQALYFSKRKKNRISVVERPFEEI